MSDSKSKKHGEDAPTAPRFFFGDERPEDSTDDAPPLGRPASWTGSGASQLGSSSASPGDEDAAPAKEDAFADARAAAEADMAAEAGGGSDFGADDGTPRASSVDADADADANDDRDSALSFMTADAGEELARPSTPPPAWNPDLPAPEIARDGAERAELVAAASGAASGSRSGGLLFVGMTVLAVGGGAFMLLNAPEPVSAEELNPGAANASLSIRPGDWFGSVDRGMSEAGRLDRPMLLFFTADWCGPCQQLKRGALSDPNVAAAIHDQFVPIKIDLTDQGGSNTALAQQYGIKGIPAMLAIDGDGDIAARWNGNPSAGAVVDWIDAAAKRAR